MFKVLRGLRPEILRNLLDIDHVSERRATANVNANANSKYNGKNSIHYFGPVLWGFIDGKIDKPRNKPESKDIIKAIALVLTPVSPLPLHFPCPSTFPSLCPFPYPQSRCPSTPTVLVGCKSDLRSSGKLQVL